MAQGTLLLDGEGENGVAVKLPAESWALDTDHGKITLDDLLDMTAAKGIEFAQRFNEMQQLAIFTVLRDKTTLAYARLRRWRDDPAGFVGNILDEYAVSYQVRIMESVRDNRMTAVPSAHGVGKSFIAARTVAWWLSTHAPGDAFVLSTAPTGDQVRSILWREINRAHSKGRLPGRTNLSQWYIGGELVALGRKPADTNPAALQGHHARHFLAVIDEGDGVVGAIFDAIRTLTTTEASRILTIGNPDTNAGRFYDACLPGSMWNVIRIPAFDTPNFNGHPLRTVPDEHGVPERVLAELVDQAFVDDIASDPHYGEDSAYYRSKVLALPPEDAPTAVMPLSKLQACMPNRDRVDRRVRWDPKTLELETGLELGPVEIGLDVGAGGDLTVARERRGPCLGRVFRVKEADTMAQLPRIVQFIRLCEADSVKVDIIGVGKGLFDRLREMRTEGAFDARVVPVNVGRSGRKATSRRPGFPKLRDQLWWEVGRANTIDMAWDLSCLYDEEWILPELFQPTYSETSSGQVKIESKDEMKKRLGHSPDDADAILLAYTQIQSPAKMSGKQLERSRL